MSRASTVVATRNDVTGDLTCGASTVRLTASSTTLTLTVFCCGEVTARVTIQHHLKIKDGVEQRPVEPGQARLAAMLDSVGKELVQELEKSKSYRPTDERLRAWLRAALVATAAEGRSY